MLHATPSRSRLRSPSFTTSCHRSGHSRPELASALTAATVGHASEEQARLIQAAEVIHNDAGLDALPGEVERAVFALLGEGALPNTPALRT